MERLKDLAGIELDPVGWKEHVASVVGGLLGMTLVAVVTTQALGLTGAAALVGSIAASAVLVFAAPLAAFSQPWPVVGGHLISAVVGLACASLLGRTPYTAALAVALAIGAMSLCRCIHPPGGATAFVAVAGGPAVAALGWSFLWHPVLVDVAVLAFVPTRLVCYRCGTSYRGARVARMHRAWDPRVAASLGRIGPELDS